ncbi:MAG: hypothetical protein H6665_00380 [Ardenticatenaceae bacterium]|nr:hypothetical protein [Ardenticatenaceae bacterium]MCB8989047.1 hypothetical protein [Ardenticatenaceae bacterium]
MRRGEQLLVVGYTAVFIGYLSVWLPGPAVGLQFLGFEIGEWIKFLGVRGSRNLFYLPPITLGLLLALWTVSWPRRWQTWAMRGVAVAVSLLAFPAIEAILGEPPSEWLLRLLLIGLVVFVALLGRVLHRWPQVAAWLMLALSLIGVLLPTWRYLTLRPYLTDVLGVPIGIGLGVWLNGAGHLLVTAVTAAKLRRRQLS